MTTPIIEIHGDLPIEPSWLSTVTEAVLKHLDQNDKTAELHIQCLDTTSMQALNYQHRNKNMTTNILSFPYQHQQGALLFLGDIVLCPEVITIEAKQANISEYQHYTHLLVHGLLHLFGFDHESNEEAIFMEHKEIRILESLNQPNPYA